jgi:hypothetical protein
MSWFYFKMLIISLGITLGLFLAYQAYKYYIGRVKKSLPFIPRIILHSLENAISKGEILFHFEIREGQEILLEICDEESQSIKILLQKQLEEGSHTCSFNTKEIANGKYFYRLKGEKQEIMKRIEVRN